MREDATQDRQNNRMHQHYSIWLVGDGAKTEFPLTTNVGRVGDVEVFVGGSLKRVADGGVAHDYSIRGLTAGYTGDKNAIKFAAAPGNGVDICVRLVAT